MAEIDQPAAPRKTFSYRDVKPWLPALLLVGISCLFFFTENKVYQSYVKYYFPLLTPLLLSAVSFLIRAGESARGTKLQGIAIDLTLGVVSFDVWAITSVLTSPIKSAQLTPEKVLDTNDVVICLLFGIFLLAACTFIIKNGGAIDDARRKASGVFVIALAVVIFFVPARIASPSTQAQAATVRPASHHFRVAVPYADTSVAHQVGQGKWGDRLLCVVYEVTGEDADSAKKQAGQLFTQSMTAAPLFQKYRGAKVTTLTDKIAAERID